MTLARFLIDNYYSKYKEAQKYAVTEEMLATGLDIHKDKVVVIKDKDKILGAAIFLTLPDYIYEDIEKYDISNLDVVKFLLEQKGNNIHFILVAGEGIGNIKKGIAKVKELRPKSISWWNPTMTKLHRFNFN